jgi:hypothetical protein
MTRPSNRRFAVELRPNSQCEGWHAVVFDGMRFVAAVALDRDEAFRLALETFREQRALRRALARAARKKLN